MSLSVLIILNAIQRKDISNEIKELFDSKISNPSLFYCLPEELGNIVISSYDLVVLQDESIALYLKSIINHRHVLKWSSRSNLSLQIDVFLQLQRHTQKYPLDLADWNLTEVLHNNSDNSIIYKAESKEGTPVAIKRFNFSPSSLSATTIQRLLARIEDQRQSCCPKGLVQFHDGGVNDQAFYLVMEYLSYGSLRQALNGCGNQLPLTHALEWFQEIVIALDCVHKFGLIHRDLKIDNIQLRRDGSLVLTDFGVSKRLLLEAGFVYENELHCSPHYVSPEQITGEACTQASDIYSLGVIFYELLTGEKPFSAKQAHELMMYHVMADVPSLPNNLKQFQPLLDRLMAKRPKDRFKSVLDAIQDLPLAA